MGKGFCKILRARPDPAALTNPSILAYFLSFAAAFGGLLFGYEIDMYFQFKLVVRGPFWRGFNGALFRSDVFAKTQGLTWPLSPNRRRMCSEFRLMMTIDVLSFPKCTHVSRGLG